eukprot:SAG11_NODE_14_length_26344_cov_14.209411_4_plen_754_part_00
MIGPCSRNQQALAVELKIDTINALLEIDYDTTDCNRFEVCSMQRKCVQMLQAMMEGCSEPSNESRRVVKALGDMKPISDPEHKLYAIVKKNIVDIHQEYQSYQGVYKATMNFIHRRDKFDPNKLKLGFQYLTLLRQMHDCMEDPKRSVPFFPEELMRSYTVTATNKAERQQQIDAQADAYNAFEFFHSIMGRIEICRYNGEPGQRIERVYYEIPYYCEYLTEETKDKMKMEINRNSDEERLVDFISRADTYRAEMNLQRELGNWRIYKFFDKRRELWTKMSFLTTICINAVLLLFVDHEDKFWTDPAVDLQGQDGTPFNIMDHLEPKIKEFDRLELYHGLAYIWKPANYALWSMGRILLVFSGITFGIFVLGFGPLIARSRFKDHHNAEQRKAKEQDPNHCVQRFDLELKKGRLWHRPIYYAKYLYYIVTDGSFVYHGYFYMGFVLLGNFGDKFFYCALLLDILKREPELLSAMEAITKPISKIIKTFTLTLIIMYVFTIISFALFHEQFNDGAVKEDNMCNSVLQCLAFTSYHGLISSELWFAMGPGDLWPYQKYSASMDPEVNYLVTFSIRWMLDVLFFLLVGVILIGGVLFGIILDNFQSIRDEKETIMREHTNTCFICSQDREKLDREGNGFDTHVHDDHNMWEYIKFIVYLLDLDPTEVNGPEAYVLDKWKSGVSEGEANIDWLPRYTSLHFSRRPKEDDSVLDKINQDVSTVQNNLLDVRSSATTVKDTVSELLTTAKLIETRRRQS